MTTARVVGERLNASRLDGGQRILERDLVIDLGEPLDIDHDAYADFHLDEGRFTLITVPRGFVTDFSSVPWWAPYRFDEVDLAGTCHDLAYRVGVPLGPADRIWWLLARSPGKPPGPAPRGAGARLRAWGRRLAGRNGLKHVGPVRGFAGWLALRIFGRFVKSHTGHALRHPKLGWTGGLVTPPIAEVPPPPP